MKKKNVLTMALSVSLVGVIAVGGTLAYLTANTGTLTNDFKFVTNGITLTLKESAEEPIFNDPDTPEDETNGFHGYDIKDFQADAGSDAMTVTTGGITYEDIVPGAVINKEPVLTVGANAVDCYVYALVKGITEDSATIHTQWNYTNWTVVEAFNGTGTLLKYNGVAKAGQALPKLFDTVYVDSTITANAVNTDLGQITIEGYAIQADGTDAVADANAADHFGGTITTAGAEVTE